MAIRSGIKSIQVKGTNRIILKMNTFQKNILAGQVSTGQELMQTAKQTASEIIQQKKAEHTTGNLQRQLRIKQEKTGKGNYTFELVANTPYAEKVHSGRPQENVSVSASLYNWIANNLSEAAAKRAEKRGYFTVGRPSSRRKYNPQTGMRFFDTPFATITNTSEKKYFAMVDRARKAANL